MNLKLVSGYVCDMADLRLTVDRVRDGDENLIQLEKVEVRVTWPEEFKESCSDDNLLLHHHNGSGHWQLVETDWDWDNRTTNNSLLFTWTLPGVIPCHENKFKLSIGGNV